MSPRVGFSLLTLFPGRVGGAETYVRGLLAEFVKDEPSRWLTVLANRHVMYAYRDGVVPAECLYHVRSYRPGDSIPTRALAMTAARVLPRLAARDVPGGLDVVHYPVTVPIPRSDTPTVVTVNDVQHHELPQFFSPFERWLRAGAYDAAARSATSVVTLSENGKAALVRHVGVQPERVHAIHLGIDLDRFAPGPVDGDKRTLGGLPIPRRFVIYPANLWPHKNHAHLLEAFAAVADRQLALVLTGQDYGRLGALMERARGLRVADRVHHLGFLSRAAMPALYRRATALVFPSLYEGFGAPPLEAMASGCPVASSTAGSLREVCGEAAVAFDPNDPGAMTAAIDQVVGDEALRARLRSAGIARAARFTWSEAAQRHRGIYARLAGANRGAPAPAPRQVDLA